MLGIGRLLAACENLLIASAYETGVVFHITLPSLLT